MAVNSEQLAVRSEEERMKKKFVSYGIMALVVAVITACTNPANPFLEKMFRGDAAHTHNWGDWTLTTAPTCTTAGEETRVCSLNAAHTETQAVAINPDAHDWGDWTQTKAPTETEDGEEVRTCALNGEHTETRAVAALGHIHDWGDWTLTTAPTCTTAGEETRVCSLNAAHTETQAVAINPDAHDWGEWTQTKAPTETEDGEEVRTCALNSEHTEIRAVAALSHIHDWGEWTVTTPATAINDGEETRICKQYSNHIERRVIPALGKSGPTVTWPTGLTATYGQTLSDIPLPGNGTSSPAGTFTWTTPDTSVGGAGTQSHNITFTPTDTENFTTLTQDVSITVNKAPGAAVTAPALNAITHNSVTIDPVTAATGQTVQYISSTTNTAPADDNAWQTNTILGGLSAGTTYYIFARSAENGNYETGAASGGLVVTTLQIVPVNRIEYYWVNEQDVIVGNAFTLPRGEILEITANDDGYSNQRWYINGAEDQLQTGNVTYFFSSGEKELKRYTVTLIVEKGGKYYNANFMVTVTE